MSDDTEYDFNWKEFGKMGFKDKKIKGGPFDGKPLYQTYLIAAAVIVAVCVVGGLLF